MHAESRASPDGTGMTTGDSPASDLKRRPSLHVRFTLRADLHASSGHVAEVPQAAVSNRSKPTLYSITSSASASSVAGTSMPNALAVFILMNNSTLVTCWIGRSAGLSPFKIRAA